METRGVHQLSFHRFVIEIGLFVCSGGTKLQDWGAAWPWVQPHSSHSLDTWRSSSSPIRRTGCFISGFSLSRRAFHSFRCTTSGCVGRQHIRTGLACAGQLHPTGSQIVTWHGSGTVGHRPSYFDQLLSSLNTIEFCLACDKTSVNIESTDRISVIARRQCGTSERRALGS